MALLAWVKKNKRCVLLSSHDLDLCLEHKLPLLAINGGQIQQLQVQSKKEVVAILLQNTAH
jgi:hypothetical protein